MSELDSGSQRTFTPAATAFLIGVPLVWAVVLMFHGNAPRDDIYSGLRDEVVRWQVVHVLTLISIGLMAAAVYLLVRNLRGTAATVSKLALLPFVLFYAAWEAVIGLATGALVQQANDAPASERPAMSDGIQALQDNAIVGDPGIVLSLGALGWWTAIIAAALAYRRAGAPRLAWVLLALSLIIVAHPPPAGPLGLVFFAVAVVLLARWERASTARSSAGGPSEPAAAPVA
jgi:hypothetical protein